METVDVLVEGGQATAGPPIGPALGPLGINIMQVVEAINQKTGAFEGMKVPVKILVDAVQGSFELEVGTPPTSALVIKEAGLEKGSGLAGSERTGNITLQQAVKIAKMKTEDMLGPGIREKVLEVLGTCLSMGVQVEGKDPREVQAEVRQGAHKGLLG